MFTFIIKETLIPETEKNPASYSTARLDLWAWGCPQRQRWKQLDSWHCRTHVDLQCSFHTREPKLHLGNWWLTQCILSQLAVFPFSFWFLTCLVGSVCSVYQRPEWVWFSLSRLPVAMHTPLVLTDEGQVYTWAQILMASWALAIKVTSPYPTPCRTWKDR